MESRLAIDSVALRDGLVFGWGWFLADEAPATHLSILVKHGSGSESRLLCTRGGDRSDVAQAHPSIPHAASAGFMVQGRLKDTRVSSATLQVVLGNGSRSELPIEGFPYRYMEPSPQADSIRSKWSVARSLLRERKFREIFAKVGRITRRAAVRVTVARSPPRAGLPVGMEIVFDHAMGGGANRFRHRLIAEIVERGGRTCTISPVLPVLGYNVRVESGSEAVDSRYRDLEQVLAAIDRSPAAIHINELVSFEDPLRIVDWATRQAGTGVPVHFYAHDYHAVCPSWTLIDDTESYCGVPALARCERCLPKLEIPFLALQPHTDIPRWRKAWGELLRVARIVVFSRSSVAILRRAFPALDETRISVRPHVVEHPAAGPAVEHPPRGPRDPIVIGVVGSISRHKGADIVWEMAESIRRRSVPARIVVVGTIENAVRDDVVAIKGPYRSEDLASILADERVDVCLLPSICPETFSYVTSELMHLDMPLVVFGIGAPAERVADYPRGRVVARIGADAALDAIVHLHHDLTGPRHPGDRQLQEPT